VARTFLLLGSGEFESWTHDVESRVLAEANGDEPHVTWPSGIQAPGMDTDGEPGCLDYIWVRGAITVDEASLAFDRPAVDDPNLYPSDHLALRARIRVGA